MALRTRLRFIRRILVLGSAPHIARLRQLTNGARGRLFEPVVAAQEAGAGVVDQSLSPGALRRRHIWGIVIAGERTDPNSLPVAALLDCKLHGVPVFDRAGFCEEQLGRIDLDRTRADWLLFADGFAHGQASNTVKRGIDIVVGLLLTVVTLPLMLVTAAAIRLDSRGPIFYRQDGPACTARPLPCLNSAA